MGRNLFCDASTTFKLSVAALALSCMSACSTNIYLADGSKAPPQGTSAPASGTGNESGAGESSAASSNDGQAPTESPRQMGGVEGQSTGGQRSYIDGQSQMRSPSGRLPDVGGAAQPTASDWEESPLLSKRHYPIPNYADPSSDAGVLPYTPHDVSSSPGYFTATTIPAPSGLVVVLGAMMRRSRRRTKH